MNCVNSVNTLDPLHKHTELCNQEQLFCICNVPHNPSCTCMTQARGRLWKPQVKLPRQFGSNRVTCKMRNAERNGTWNGIWNGIWNECIT